ncbi:MAG: sigma-70 family RNA polymerase sigma factor [Phycisphaerales bacterium]|nr:sigma-70 family RNA polymerase sigma factor [Phycisphaerales bacterium]
MERKAFEQAALEHLDAVYRMAYHLAQNADEANDLVQEVYLRAFRPQAIEGFESKGGGMRAWLFTITHNVFYSRLKRESRAPQAVGEFFSEADTRAPDEPPPAWDRSALDWDHVDDRLRQAIGDLKEEYREVLMMWGVDGLKYREISAILEVPIGTVMSRLHRARKIVAERLMDDEHAARDLGLGVMKP